MTEVHVDPVRGHIRVEDLTFADVGPCLDVWSYSGASLDRDTARTLGQALIAWADKPLRVAGGNWKGQPL